MSYILDALRRSERERQQAEPLVLAPVAPQAVELPRRRFGPAGSLAALALAATALGIAWLYVGRAQAPRAMPAPLSNPLEPTAAKPVEAEARATPPPVRPAPELKPNPFAAASVETGVRDLAQEARVEPPAPKPTPSAPTPVPVATAAVAPAPTANAPATEPAKFLRAMPLEFQRALPELVVNIHIYAPRSADCILYINNRQYHAGDTVSDGVVVEEIVQDGAVLSYRGQLFKLPRPM